MRCPFRFLRSNPLAVFLHMSPTFAVKAVSSKVLSSFGIVLACTFAFLVLVFVFLIFVDFGFLSFALSFTFLDTFAFLALSSFTHHR